MSRYVYWISERTPQGLASAISRAPVETALASEGEVCAYIVRIDPPGSDCVTKRALLIADVVRLTDEPDDADFVDLLREHGDPHHVTMPSPGADVDITRLPTDIGLIRTGMHRAESHRVVAVERDERGTIAAFYVEGGADPIPARKAVWVRYPEARS